jgi:TetR/AcrR family transcriptional repressor of nem operon
MTKLEGTRVRAIQEARGLLQTYGFNGFSFQHLADALGIKKPSLYDHFESKEDLGLVLIEDYLKTSKEWMETVASFEPLDKLGASYEQYVKFAHDKKRLCPLTAFSGEYNSLPESIQKGILTIVELRKGWLKSVLEEGQSKGVFRKDLSSDVLTQMVFTMGIGTQLVARLTNAPETIRAMKIQILKFLQEGIAQ